MLLAGFIVVMNLNAQPESKETSGEMQTVFGKSAQPSVGWFIGFDHTYSQFDKRDVWMGGLNFGMVIDHRLSLGLAGNGWYKRNEMYYPGITDTSGAYLEGGYGGFLIEYTLFPKSPVHLTFPLLIGGGGASYVSDQEYLEWDEDEWDSEHVVLDTDVFFVIEPGVRAEINLLKFMRLTAGVSYRYVPNLEMVHTSADMLNNLNATMGLKFGKF